jgi:Uncharacterized protein conserved in bacteria (DUF2252)
VVELNSETIMESIVSSVARIEAWTDSLIALVPEDREKKHRVMAKNDFVLLRGTCHRWLEAFPVLCPELVEDTPIVPSIVDAHLLNHGTYLDAEGRIILDNNDRDEAWPMEWTNDIVRLGTSCVVDNPRMSLNFEHTCDAIKTGYRKGLENGPKAFVLALKHRKLRRMAIRRLQQQDIELFWEKLLSLPLAKDVPASARKAFTASFPKGTKFTIHTRVAGVGSLGRQRFVALAMIGDDWVAREAKAYLPSAMAMVQNVSNPPCYFQQIIDHSVCSPDPYLKIIGKWIVRRLSPACSKFELRDLAGSDEWALLKAFGRIACNIHTWDPKVRRRVLADFQRRPKYWLEDGIEKMSALTKNDRKDWRQHMKALAKAA